MRKHFLLACMLCVSSGAIAGVGEGCNMKVTGIGVHKDDFRFSTSAGEKLGSTSLGYQVQNERQMKVVTIAYVTGVDVCIEINRYTYYYWEIKEIYIKNPKPQKNS